MSNLTLHIGGRSFVVACAPGEEAHVTSLARTIDAKLAGLGETAVPGDSRMLLFAALLLADELHERDQGAPTGIDAGVAQSLAAIAGRLERLAEKLEEAAAST